MKGIIVIWSGSIVGIPAGWQLCNGTNGTPDLRNNFVLGAGDTYPVDDSGGSIGHDHDFESDGHFHTMSPPTDVAPGASHNSITSTDTDDGTTDSSDCLPPYYALAYIQKL